MGQTVDRDEMKGALWPRTAKESGLHYHSGQMKINGVWYNVAMYLNTRRENDKQPEYNLKISIPQQTEQPPAGEYSDTSGNGGRTFGGPEDTNEYKKDNRR
jgi:hypothetical protein